MSSLGAKAVVVVSNAARSLGHKLDALGASLEVAKYTERLVPSTRFVSVDGVAPNVSVLAAFVAPTANIIGDVSIGDSSSVWYGATIRGDGNKVTIGSNSSIGDRALIHITRIQSNFPTNIGSNVTIGPGAIIHAATLKDHSIIGPSAQVLDGATVGSQSVLAAGALLGPGKDIPDGELWAGMPAKKVRDLSPEEKEGMGGADMGDSSIVAEDVKELAVLHAVECNKDYATVMADEEKWQDGEERSPDYFQPLEKGAAEDGTVLGQGMPGRIFDNTLSHPEEGLKRKTTE